MNSVIPDGFAPYTYLMDPDTEDLIFGDDLADGMVVLVEESRPDPDGFEQTDAYARKEILRSSRWCRVARLRFSSESYGTVAHFVAEYSDGSKMVRIYNTCTAWVVKKSSVPAECPAGPA